MSTASEKLYPQLRPSLVRMVLFFAVWLIIAGITPIDMLVGLMAAAVATYVSLQLLPAGQVKVSPAALAYLVLRFLYQSIVAGFDVARRALDPRLPLRPGFVTFNSQLPAGPKRDAFCTMTSLLPGTLPCGPSEEGGLLVHCLDIGQPMAEQLAIEEHLFRSALDGSVREVRS